MAERDRTKRAVEHPAATREGPHLPISACVITMDEESNIRECLDSLSFCAETIVVDSHSTDETRSIAERLGARVIERDWPGHIEQKNFAIEQAEHDWVLCIDADERITDALREVIHEEFESGERGVTADGYSVRRKSRYLGRWIQGCGWYPDRKLRLFRRTRGHWIGVNPHDHVQLEGKVRALDVDILHFSYRDLADHLRTINSFTTIAAREKLKRGQRLVWLRLLFAPPFKFFRMYVLQRGVFDGWPGMVCSAMGAWYVFLKYAKLWELLHASDTDAERAKSSYEGA